MAANIIKKTHMYPKSLAEADPNFDWGLWDTEPVTLESGEVALVSIEYDNIILNLIEQLPHDQNIIMDFMQEAIDQTVKKLQWTDNGYVINFEFSDPVFDEILKFLTDSYSE